MKKIHTLPVVVMLMFLLQSVSAHPLESRLREAFKATNPDITVESVSDSAATGIKEVKLSNGEYLYATEDGRHLFSGKLIELEDTSFQDLTEKRMRQDRVDILRSLDLSRTITYQANGNQIHEIFVFTDVSCGYCKNFHSHIDEIAGDGITVHYLAFPRAGVTSPIGELMGRAWCSENQQAALTEVKTTNRLSQAPIPCRSPIAEHYSLAQKLGVSGTPAIFDQQGNNLGGYLTPEQLVTALSR